MTDPDNRVQFAAIDAELTFVLVEPIGGRAILTFGGSKSRAQEAFEAGPLVRAGGHPPAILIDQLIAAIRDENGIALIINGTADHLHILAKLRSDKAVSKLIGEVKANSSGWISETFRECRAFAWQEGYGAFTVSGSMVSRIY